MQVYPTDIKEVLIIEPVVHRDQRGFFLESYHFRKYQQHGLPLAFVQDNHSRSSYGILRGLHAQVRHPQGKLVRVIEGEIFDVAVDIRPDSVTFGRWVGVTLTSKNFRQCYIPQGFAHGFCVVSNEAQVEYKCTDYYDPTDELTIRWNDPHIQIQWPLSDPILSLKDSTAPFLEEIRSRLSAFSQR